MQILKLGGSAITRKGGYMQEDRAGIALLAKTVAAVRRKGVKELVIVHGAGSFGHAPVLKYGIRKGVRTARQKLGFAVTHDSCARLSSFVAGALLKHGVPAVSIPPSALIVQKNGRISSFDAKPVRFFLSKGFVPILYGDMVPDSKIGGSVCSGDQIVAYLGKKARRIVLATNVDGVFAHGRVVPEINGRNFNKIKKHIGHSACPDVTGGMAGKIMEIMASKTPAYVVNARKPARVASLLLGNSAISTKIVP